MSTMASRFAHLPNEEEDGAAQLSTAASGAIGREGDDSNTRYVAPAREQVAPVLRLGEDGPRYRVKSVLGSGGMGEVRLCTDRRIGREVAIKVAHDLDDPEVRVRFLRESRLQGQLEHPAIVPVYDLEIFEDGSAYFAMKRVRGVTLAAILTELQQGDAEMERRFPRHKLLAAFNSICIAVDFAHSKGILHRDIKPANIMLGDFGEVYLLDWGLAKSLGAQDDAVADLATVGAHRRAVNDATIMGGVFGTPGYMAPEQLEPSLGPLSPAVDVYALGAVLFEILAGTRYITAKSEEATAATLRGAERRPSRIAPPAIAAQIPPSLDDVCERALAREPHHRFETARALYEAVDAHLSGENDRARRRALSAQHLEAANRQSGDDLGQSIALQELGSALALDPDNAAARHALLRLLTKPPSEIPPEVKQRVREDEHGRVRSIARLSAVSNLTFTPFIPLMLLIGVLDFTTFALAFGCIAIASLLDVLVMRARVPHPALEMLAHLPYMVAMLLFAQVAGPLLILPALLVGYSVNMQMQPAATARRTALLLCCLTLIIAVALEMAGLVPPSYSVIDGGLVIHSRMIELSEGALWLFATASVATIISPTIIAGRLREALGEAEAKLHLQAWQFRQLVPQETPGDPAAASPSTATATTDADRG